MQPLPVEILRHLHTLDSPRPSGHAHVAAASGLVRVGSHLVVAADDEDALGIFPSTGSAPGTWFRLSDRVLPVDEAARKAVKRDFEALTLVDSTTLLCIGSGSKATRNLAMRVPLSRDGLPQAPSTTLDFSAVYAEAGRQIADLNIEGAVMLGKTLRLFQRGNGAAGINAFVDVDFPALSLKGITRVELGSLQGVPLGFTDAALLPDGTIAFSAAAEDSKSTYLDGVCTGSVVGVMAPDGRVLKMHPLDRCVKVEGIEVMEVSGSGTVLWMVADGDDPEKPAPLMRTVI